MVHGANRVFEGKLLPAVGSGPKLHIAMDYVDTLTGADLLPREDFLRSLVLLKLQGHAVSFFSYGSIGDVSDMYRQDVVPQYMKKWGFTDEQRDIVLADDFCVFRRWYMIEEGSFFDLVFDSFERPACEFGVHLSPRGAGFNRFVQGVLSDPTRNIEVLVENCVRDGGQLGVFPTGNAMPGYGYGSSS